MTRVAGQNDAVRASRPLAAIAVTVLIAAVVGACTANSPGDPTNSPAPTVTRPPAPEGELPAALQGKLQAALDQTMKEYGVPGAAVGVWIPGEGAWTKAAGLADIDNDVPASTDMTWPLRSVTKSYTVTLILQLVDERAIRLDDTIDQYVDGVTNGDTITLRQLADMSSGNADYTNDDFLAEFQKDPSKIFTLDELNGFMLGKTEQFAPGAKKVYTNANTNLLGAVVEKVTGQPYAEVLAQRILVPLGQEHTRYILDAGTWPNRTRSVRAGRDRPADPTRQPVDLRPGRFHDHHHRGWSGVGGDPCHRSAAETRDPSRTAAGGTPRCRPSV